MNVLKMIMKLVENFQYGGKTLDCSPIVRVLKGKQNIPHRCKNNYYIHVHVYTRKLMLSLLDADIHPIMIAGNPQDAQEFYIFLMDKFAGMSRR